MYELNSWFRLAESAYEADVGGLEAKFDSIQEIMTRWPHTLSGRGVFVNGSCYLTVTCSANRRRSHEEGLIDEILKIVRQQLPGSYGIIYERDDEATDLVEQNSFRVTVLARGRLSVREDPFLSPITPTIED